MAGKLRNYLGDKIGIAVGMYFIIYLTFGTIALKDYGVTGDEPIQRLRSLVSYKHINQVLFGREIDELKDIPNLNDFGHLYYGTAVQIPMVIIEDLTNFTMTSRQIYLVRHCITFAIIYCGYICLYFALRKIFGRNTWTALIVVMMISLYPRFFAFQFFDVKNLMFAGLSMIVFLSLVYMVEIRSILHCTVFGILSAVATNSRMMGVLYPVVALVYFLIDDIRNFFESKQRTSNTIQRGDMCEKFHHKSIMRWKSIKGLLGYKSIGGGIAEVYCGSILFCNFVVCHKPICMERSD